MSKSSIYDIAEIACVSPGTVSKVINGRAGVSPGVRDRVFKIIQEQNFIPKTSVNETNNIAVITKDANNMFYSNFFIGLMRGISEFVFEHNYNLMLFSSVSIPKTKRQFSLFCRKHNLLGVIFGNIQNDEQFIGEISGIVPIVVINANYTGDKVYSICSDDYNGVYESVKYLYEMNHRRIAILGNGLRYIKSYADRIEGYKKAVSDFDLVIDSDYIMDISDISSMSICNRFLQLRQEGKMPTALLTMNDDDAVHIIGFLRLVGIQCPDALSVMGFDDYDYAKNFHPALTTVSQALYEKGKLAARLASGLSEDVTLFRNEQGSYIYKTQIVVRESVVSLPLASED